MSLNQIYDGQGLHNLFADNCIISEDLNIVKPFGPHLVYVESVIDPWKRIDEVTSLSMGHYITTLSSADINTTDYTNIYIPDLPISQNIPQITRVTAGDPLKAVLQFDRTLNGIFLVYLKLAIPVVESGDSYEFRPEIKIAPDYTLPDIGWIAYNPGAASTTVLSVPPYIVDGETYSLQTLNLSFPIDTYDITAGNDLFFRIVGKKVSAFTKDSTISGANTCLSIIKVS